MTTNNGDAILTMAERGSGISQVPTFIAGDSIRAGYLKQILSDYVPAPIGLYALYPTSRNLPLKVRVFIDFMRNWFRNDPKWDDGSVAGRPQEPVPFRTRCNDQTRNR